MISSLKECFRLPNPTWWPVFMILLAGKVGYVLLNGVSYEMDTATYLLYSTPYHHPPLYAWFISLLASLFSTVYLIAIAQATLFSLSASVTLIHFFRQRSALYLMAILLALEPTSSFFCTNLMSECLFGSLLMLWFVFLSQYLRSSDRSGQWSMLSLLALVGASLYATRLAAIFLLPFFLVAVWLSTRSFKRVLIHSAALVLLVELLLVPVKLTYLKRYESYSFSMFSGTNLWNSASVLYPDSTVRTQPSTEFEQFMARRGVDEFTTPNSLDGIPIHGAESGYVAFTEGRRMTWSERKAFEQTLGRTSRRMILENPLGYWERFVWPNLCKPIVKSEEIPISPRVATLMRERFDYAQQGNVTYSRFGWQFFTLILIGVSLGSVWSWRRAPFSALIALSVWYHWLALGGVASISLRYLLVFAPLILIAAGVQLCLRLAPDAGGEDLE